MAWSAENVLDFGPALHRKGLRWSKKSNLLWPVRAWRVVTPRLAESGVNILQRAVLRFYVAGFPSFEDAGALLGIEPQLVAHVAEELKLMGYLSSNDLVTAQGERALEGNLLMGETSVGWVFQDTFTGRILPRFVTELKIANIEPGDDGRAWVLSGSKGSPRRDPAFVVRRGNAPVIQPTPQEIMDAARRHKRHGRRAEQSDRDLTPVMTTDLHNVSLISEHPEDYHLLTYIYVPEKPEYEEEPWYVADPFGFGASPSLREQFIREHENAPDGLREHLDRITGEHIARQRESWKEIQEFQLLEAREKVTAILPLDLAEMDGVIRKKLELAYVGLIRAEHMQQERMDVECDIDDAYLRLRQSIEKALRCLAEIAPPGDAWQKLFEGSRWLPGNATKHVIKTCAEVLGCRSPLPEAILGATPNKVKSACKFKNSSNLRPMCAAYILAATDNKDHPFGKIIRKSPAWIHDANRIADIAGGEIHGEDQGRSLKDLRKDIEVTARLCGDVLAVING